LVTEQVRLRFRQGAPVVFVRDITGHDEWAVDGARTRTAVDLIQRLVEWPSGQAGAADELTAPDRDALLAVIYSRAYGDRVETTAFCTACGSPYDIAFSLADMRDILARNASEEKIETSPDGTFRSETGLRFRLASARDELEVSSLPEAESVRALAKRCLLESNPGDDSSNDDQTLAELESAMEDIAPVLDVDINTACPECRAPQTIRFDVQFYLLLALEQDRTKLAREIHYIASTYSWSLQEVLSLERTERRRLVQFIEEDIAGRRRSQ
jgi:hypothetical protein